MIASAREFRCEGIHRISVTNVGMWTRMPGKYRSCELTIIEKESRATANLVIFSNVIVLYSCSRIRVI